MFSYALKAAALDAAQLADRADRLVAAGLPVDLELHTFGRSDLADAGGRARCIDNLTRLRENHEAVRLTLHVPFQDVRTVTRADFDGVQVEDAIEFAGRIGARQVVAHRYWGLVFGQAPPRADRDVATAAFNEVVRRLAAIDTATTLLIENVGHYSLLPRDGRSFLSGPLDHFFPWEMAAFRQFTAANGLTNVEPFVDVAHATLSANLFNWRRTHYRETTGDARFSAILDSDLDRAADLHPFDFVDPAMPWMHVSDSIYYPTGSERPAEIPLDALVSEGLELGTGTLPFEQLRQRLDASRDVGLVLEVEPGPGESHARNAAQGRSLARLRRLLDGD